MIACARSASDRSAVPARGTVRCGRTLARSCKVQPPLDNPKRGGGPAARLAAGGSSARAICCACAVASGRCSAVSSERATARCARTSPSGANCHNVAATSCARRQVLRTRVVAIGTYQRRCKAGCAVSMAARTGVSSAPGTAASPASEFDEAIRTAHRGIGAARTNSTARQSSDRRRRARRGRARQEGATDDQPSSSRSARRPGAGSPGPKSMRTSAKSHGPSRCDTTGPNEVGGDERGQGGVEAVVEHFLERSAAWFAPGCR